MKFVDALRSGVLVGDGANGTWLSQNGYPKQPYDWACLDAPQLVRESHIAYLNAGADFIETNTFQANQLRLVERGHELDALNERAVELAREAASTFEDRFVLGAIGPCGRPVEPIGSVTLAEVENAVARQAATLAKAGVDGFILETFIEMSELGAAVRGIRRVSQLPIVACKAFVEDGEALAEGLPVRCAQEMSAMDVVAVGANCIVGPQRMTDLVRMMREGAQWPIAAFPTPGFPQLLKGQVVYDASPEYFGKATARLIDEGASIVGGCCGSTPAHIAGLREEIARRKPVVRAAFGTTRSVASPKPLEETPPSGFAQKLSRGQFIKAVELDVPRGLNIDKLLVAAEKMQQLGADVVNISDGARARLRMTPTAVASLIQNRSGAEVVMHFSCRDRNILAIQADLLGAHALGVRNILAVTGDPTNVGDYPSATSVFDVDAIGLVRILSRFNQGLDLAGYSIGTKCGFTIAVAYNPQAPDPAFETDRLARKVDAGANVIYTQPIFDVKGLDSCLQAGIAHKLPVLVGVLPVRSSRHAEFMHNEVPGIQVPAELRSAMAAAENDAAALEIGVEAARALVLEVAKSAAGVYLMPPFGNAAIAERVLEVVRDPTVQ